MATLTRPNEGDLQIIAEVSNIDVEFLDNILVNVVDFDAIHDNISNEIALITGATPSEGDFFVFEDASDSYNKKKVDYHFLTGNEVPNDYAAPAAPTNFVFTAAGLNFVSAWDKNTEVDMSNGFGYYQLDYSTDNFATVAGTVYPSGNFFNLGTQALGTTYYVRVRAVDAWGNVSPYTSVLSSTVTGIATSRITNFAEDVSDQVGTMVTGNTETGITVTYQDSDNTLDFELSPTYSTSTVRLCDWSLGSFVEWDLGTSGTARMKYIKVGKKVEGWIYVSIDEDYLVPSGYMIVVHPDDMPYTPKAETFASGYPQPGGFGVLYRGDDAATPGNEGYRHGLSPVVVDIGTGESVMVFFRTESASGIAASLDNNWSPLFGTPIAANNYYNSQYIGYFVYETTD